MEVYLSTHSASPRALMPQVSIKGFVKRARPLVVAFAFSSNTLFHLQSHRHDHTFNSYRCSCRFSSTSRIFQRRNRSKVPRNTSGDVRECRTG